MRTLHTTAVAAALALHTSAALACFPYVVSFDTAAPADGATDVPTDGAFTLSWTTNWGTGSAGCISEPYFDVSVRDATTQDLLPGTLSRWNAGTWCDGTAMVLWQPATALPFDREVSVSAVVQQGVSGLPDQTWTSAFTTGQGTIPPLVVSGTLEVAIDVVWETIASCMQPEPCGGGGGCTEETKKVVRASVKLTDPMSGGQTALGYEVDFAVGVDVPPTFDASPPGGAIALGQGYSQTGEPNYATIRLPERGAPYVPCFAAIVRDASGKVASPEPLCLGAVDPEAMVTGTEQDAGADAPVGPPGWDGGSQDSDVDPPNSDPGVAADTAGSDGGCAIAAPGTRSHWLVSVTGLLMLAGLLRRRR